MAESAPEKRLFFAAQSAMLFANFLDTFIVRHLTNELKEISEDVAGGILTIQYAAEVELVARLLYYLPSLLSAGRTIGHDFCGFQLFRSIYNRHQSPKAYGASGVASRSNTNAIGPLRKIDFVTLAVLSAVLPYIHERKGAICRKFFEFWNMLTSKEEGICIFGTEEEETAEETAEGGNSASSTFRSNLSSSDHSDKSEGNTGSGSDSRSRITIPANQKSVFSIIGAGIYSSILSIAQDTDTRLDFVTNFMKDVHRYFFFAAGRYLDFSLRLLDVRLLSSSRPEYKSSFRVLSWLLGFRISLLVYYAARVLLSEIDREWEASIEDAQLAPAVSPRDSVVVGGPSSGQMEQQLIEEAATAASPRSCALCMDTMKHPAVIPCGHFFCWTCIVSYGYSRHSNTSDHNAAEERSADGASGRKHMKCPVCRAEFPQQKIRALYSY